MSKYQLQVSVGINNSPEAVIGFIADIRNRAKYLQALKSISDIQGEPGEIGSNWHWKWDLMGIEIEGTGRCVEYEAGRYYAFVTEGGVTSQFRYTAQEQDGGTNLTIDVSFEAPEALLEKASVEELLENAKQRGNAAVQNLKAMLEN